MNTSLAVLVVIAHQGDETLYAAFLHALTHKLDAIVDLVCITNGEGGFRYSAPSESLYNNLQLSTEHIGRQHLPRIRKQELLASGKILGLRKFFFYEQLDLKYDRNVDIVFSNQWDKQYVCQQLMQTIMNGNGAIGYDIMLIMLPYIESHGHHSASGIVALEAIESLKKDSSLNIKIPTVIAGSEHILNQLPTYPSHSLSKISSNLPNQFIFNRTWKLSETNRICDYRTIVIWTCSEHKSQSALISETLTIYNKENEQYFYMSINDELSDQSRLLLIQNLFIQLADIHQYNTGNNSLSYTIANNDK